jgi:hypothetical protein
MLEDIRFIPGAIPWLKVFQNQLRYLFIHRSVDLCAIGLIDFVSIVLSRIVACSYHDAGICIHSLYSKRHKRCRDVIFKHVNVDTFTFERIGSQSGEARRVVTCVMSNDDGEGFSSRTRGEKVLSNALTGLNNCQAVHKSETCLHSTSQTSCAELNTIS